MIYQKSRLKSKQEVLQLKPPSLCFQTLMVGLCVLALSIYSVQTATCPASVSSSLATVTERYTFTGSVPVRTYGVVAGPVSNSLYYMDYLYTSDSYAVVRKFDTSGSRTWMASFNLNLNGKSFAVDASERSVYLSTYSNNLEVLKLDASTGAIASQHLL